jgi:hypothetical protein
MPTRSRRPAWRWPRRPGSPGRLRGERCLIRTPKRPAGRPVSSRRIRLGAAPCLSDARARRQAPVSGPPDSPVHRCGQGPDLTAVSTSPLSPPDDAIRIWLICLDREAPGSSLIAVAPVLRRSCMPHRPWPLAVKLIAGHGAGGGDPAGTPRCRRRPRPASGAGPGAGRELAGGRGCRPWIIRRPDPRQAVRPPGNLRHGRARPAAVQLAGTWEDVAARNARTLSRRHAK